MYLFVVYNEARKTINFNAFLYVNNAVTLLHQTTPIWTYSLPHDKVDDRIIKTDNDEMPYTDRLLN